MPIDKRIQIGLYSPLQILMTILVQHLFQKNKGFFDILTIACSLIMALGTLTGGKRIIKSIGMDMINLTLKDHVSYTYNHFLGILPSLKPNHN